MKTQTQAVCIDKLSTVLPSFWSEAVNNGEIHIRLGDGAEGGLKTVAPGEFDWSALDERHQPITPVELVEHCGPFVKVWNWLRSHKIGAPKEIRFGRLPAPTRDNFLVSKPDDSRSIVNRPWLAVLAHGTTKLAAIPNAFPYLKDGPHYMVIPAAWEDESAVQFPYVPQRMTLETARYILEIAASVGADFCVSRNEIHAGCSQDWQHDHLLGCQLFPVEKVYRAKAGRFTYPLGYPAGCVVIERADTMSLWQCITRLQDMEIPFNLLIRDRTVFLFARRVEFEMVSHFPCGVMAVSELSGRLLIGDKDLWRNLDEMTIRTAMARTTRSVEETLAILNG